MKGQGATEYLVLLAVVLIIALVSIALLGFFPGIAGDTAANQSRAYWSGAAKPFHVLDGTALASDSPCGISGHGGYQITLLNNDPDSLTLSGVSVNGVASTFCLPGDAAPSTTFSFGPGSKRTINIDIGSAVSCTTGKPAEIGLGFTYSTKYLTLTQNGSKKFVFTCTGGTTGTTYTCGGKTFGTCAPGQTCCNCPSGYTCLSNCGSCSGS